MNAKIGHAVSVFQNMMRKEAEAEKLRRQLSLWVARLSDEEFAEYYVLTEKIRATENVKGDKY